MGEDRELDVVIYGASGFVGQLTAAYLAGAAPKGTRIALAGRSRDKLERVRSELGAAAADWSILIADSADRAALDEIATRTRAVATTVGPYRRYGMPLAEACAAAGTHYADLTGEVLFIRETIDSLQDVAAGSGARIVHSCGFDSVPSDIGVLLLHEQAKADGGSGGLNEVTAVYGPMRGGFSGGTIASLKGQIDEIKAKPKLRQIALDPYALSPDRSQDPDGKADRDPLRPHKEPEFGVWTAPFVMAFFNTRIVRRSNALAGYAYGHQFRYRELMATGSGPLGAAAAAGVAAGLGGLFGGLSLKPTRLLLDRLLPDPGEGPSPEAQRKGHFTLRLRGRTAEGDRVNATVGAPTDPGYSATAVMLGEAALSLALDGPDLPQAAGVLTPATGIGMRLAERLREAGHTYESARG
jgi:short subunit dehydrogenase-like uncharacterized protein